MNTNSTQQTDREKALAWWNDLDGTGQKNWKLCKDYFGVAENPGHLEPEQIEHILRSETQPTTTDNPFSEIEKKVKDKDAIDSVFGMLRGEEKTTDKGGELKCTEGNWKKVGFSNNKAVIKADNPDDPIQPFTICTLFGHKDNPEVDANAD